MLQIRFGPAVTIGAGIGAAGDGGWAPVHWMGERTGTEISVATEIGGDHIHPELQGFCHAAPEAIEGQEVMERQALSDQYKPLILGGAGLQPVPFGAAALGREAFDQQGHVLGERVDVALPPNRGRQVGQGEAQLEGLKGRNRIFADGGGVEIEAIAKQQRLAGQAVASAGGRMGLSAVGPAKAAAVKLLDDQSSSATWRRGCQPSSHCCVSQAQLLRCSARAGDHSRSPAANGPGSAPPRPPG